MENKGLIFIPDISGFTRFVNDTEIEHSSFIIQELLELIINSNQMGLEISEIEGDAILFYKYGESPDLNELYKQVEKMFCSFHRYLAGYELRRICQCSACKSAAGLTLKVITHYGEFTSYNVKNFSKLIGKDIIVAHQLLKNDIETHEYWLVTPDLFQSKTAPELPGWIDWNKSSKTTDSGQIPFHFAKLTPLRESMPQVPPLQLEIPDKVKVISLSKEYSADINTVFYTTINFDLRQRWQVGLKAADQVSHKLPQVGTKHRCILDKGQLIRYSSTFSYDPDRIEYSETDDNKKSAVYLTFEKTGEKTTRITLDFYLKKNIIMLTMFRLMMKKKLENMFRQSMVNLEAIVREVKLPVEVV